MEALTVWLMKPGAPDIAHTPREVLNRPGWHAKAVCRGQGVSRWVLDSRMASYASQKAVCEMCPVQAECLEYALGHPELVGCWGGTNDLERRRMRQLAKRTSA